jgi:hypothetical protein
MREPKRRNRVVAFRISDAEYSRALAVCEASGLPSVSYLARTLLLKHDTEAPIVTSPASTASLSEQVQELSKFVLNLSMTVLDVVSRKPQGEEGQIMAAPRTPELAPSAESTGK